MKQILKIGAWLLLTFFLAACGTDPIGKNFEFDATKDYSLLAYDIYFISETSPHFDLYLFPYNPETKTIDSGKRITTGCGFYCTRKNEGPVTYINVIKPGTYVIGYMFYTQLFDNSILCYSDKTIQLVIAPGKVYYLGQVDVTPTHPFGLNMTDLEVLPRTREYAEARLAKFPRVLEVDPYFNPDGTRRLVKNEKPSADLVMVPLDYVSYERGEIKREGACVRGYLD